MNIAVLPSSWSPQHLQNGDGSPDQLKYRGLQRGHRQFPSCVLDGTFLNLYCFILAPAASKQWTFDNQTWLYVKILKLASTTVRIRPMSDVTGLDSPHILAKRGLNKD